MFSEVARKPKFPIVMLLLTTCIVAAVGVSTAQVINTLSDGSDLVPIGRSDQSKAISPDLSVTLITVGEPGVDTLVIKNISGTELHIDEFNKNALSQYGDQVACASRCELTSIQLKPSEQISLSLDGRASFGERSGTRVLAMRGRVIDGKVVLLAD